jgi:integrase
LSSQLPLQRASAALLARLTTSRVLSGTPYSASTVARIRLHDLRHTWASLALAAGINPKVVSERLGHATVSFTLDTYSHVMPGLQEDAAARVAALLRD